MEFINLVVHSQFNYMIISTKFECEIVIDTCYLMIKWKLIKSHNNLKNLQPIII